MKKLTRKEKATLAMNNLSAYTLNNLSAYTLKNLSAYTLNNLSAYTLKNLSADTLKNLSADTLKNLSAYTLNNLSADTLKNLSAYTLKNLSAYTLNNLSAYTLNNLSAYTLNNLSAYTLKNLNPEALIVFKGIMDSIPLLVKPYTKLLQDINDKKRVHQQSTFGPEDMDCTKNVCGTPMCTAGHLVNMAGAAGYKLKEKYGWAGAAGLIHHKCHPDLPMQNFGSIPQDWALAYIEEMAEAEKTK